LIHVSRQRQNSTFARFGWLLLISALVTAASSISLSLIAAAATNPPIAVPEMDSPAAAVELITSNLQLDLQAHGDNPGPITGRFTTQTEQALIKFQGHALAGTSERGAFGPRTAAALQLGKAPGTEVEALQSALTDVGLFKGTINGRYDGATVAAVSALQRATHVGVSGYFDRQTAPAFAALYIRDVPRSSAAISASRVPATKTTTAPLSLGSKGQTVAKLQKRLTSLGYRPGATDGLYGASTASAVLAFEKREGLPRDGQAGSQVLSALQHPTGAGPKSGLPTPRVEVDIARQIAFVVRPHQPVITLNVSTGSGLSYTVPGGGRDVAYTPVGSFKVLRKISGDEVAPLGTLHSPSYFYRGWAIHGASSVPAYPASHGCVRVSNTDADWLFPLIPVGTTVVLYDSTGKSPRIGPQLGTAAPGY
jgi:peptidoglycan hydrolase-like protein with peptidoglycan-binding domain